MASSGQPVESVLNSFDLLVNATPTVVNPASISNPVVLTLPPLIGARGQLGITIEIAATEPGDVKLGRAGQSPLLRFHIVQRGPVGLFPIACLEKAAKALRGGPTAGPPSVQVAVWA